MFFAALLLLYPYKNVRAKATPSCPDSFRAAEATDVCVTLSWKKVKKASGYYIYRKSTGSEKYRRIATLKSRGSTSYMDTDLTPDTTWRYKICSYRKKSGKITKSAFSEPISVRTVTETSAKVNADAITFDKNRVHILRGGHSSVKGRAISIQTGKAILDKKVTYYSSNENIATVGKTSGKITAKSAGTCKIRCRAHNGLIKSITVKVKKSIKPSDFTFIGHRGYQDAYPENTITAFQGALDIGCVGIECDVWEAENGDLMVFHDGDITRMCGGTKEITEITTDNRKDYKIIYGSNSDKYGPLLIPTLDETLKAMKAQNATVYIHLKYRDSFSSEGLEKIAALIDKYDMAASTVVFCGQNKTLRRLTELGLTVGKIIYSGAKTEVYSQIDWCAAHGITYLYFMKADMIKKDYVDRCHEAGIKAGVYSTKTKKQALFLMDIGADFAMLYHNVF